MIIHDQQHGLTLIELMIVIAVIGLLATMTIPKMDYIKRAKVSEALSALSAAKTVVSEAAVLTGQMPLPEMVSIAAHSTYVQQVTYTRLAPDRGAITAATTGVGDDATNINVSLIGVLSEGTLSWVCKTGDSVGMNGLPAQYVPANCR